MIILAIDTAANLCAACVYDTASAELGRCVRDLGKGHAEHLMAVIDEALANAGKTYADLGAIAVSVGPGSFTGIRVGVAAARGLALALKIPAIGVTTLEAFAFEARQKNPGRAVLAAIDGGRGEFHVALYGADGLERVAPAAMSLETVKAMRAESAAIVVGSADAAFGEDAGAAKAATADIGSYARLAASRPAGGAKPVPLYLRSADAKVQEGFAVRRKAAS